VPPCLDRSRTAIAREIDLSKSGIIRDQKQWAERRVGMGVGREIHGNILLARKFAAPCPSSD